jgi:hypothetical protein
VARAYICSLPLGTPRPARRRLRQRPVAAPQRALRLVEAAVGLDLAVRLAGALGAEQELVLFGARQGRGVTVVVTMVVVVVAVMVAGRALWVGEGQSVIWGGAELCW